MDTIISFVESVTVYKFQKKPSDTEKFYTKNYYSFSEASGYIFKKLTYLGDKYNI